MRVAVMQPYFVPYAGYFRLFAATDLFVCLDCVQFPRRGWVHRNRLPNAAGTLQWLTLPLAKTSRDTVIRDLRFADDAPAEMGTRMRRFPCLADAGPRADGLVDRILETRGDVTSYLLETLRLCCERLGLPFNIVRSSDLDLPPGARGAARIQAAVHEVGGDTYVNAPGGQALYDDGSFTAAGLTLRFLPPYDGPSDSILYRLLAETPAAVAAELGSQLALEPSRA